MSDAPDNPQVTDTQNALQSAIDRKILAARGVSAGGAW